MFTSN